MNITIILIIILTIISLILFTFIWGRETFKPVNGICAFDIDGTSLQGMNNTCYYRNNKYDHTNGGCSAAAIQACKDKGYVIAVNTASGRDRGKYCCRSGFCNKNNYCEVRENNWWNNQKYYNTNSKQGSNHGECGKPYILKELMKNYGIKNRKNVVLWDDYHENITGAQSAGFGVIAMNNLNNCSSNYGLNEGIKQNNLDDFINNNTNFIPCEKVNNQKCIIINHVR